MTATEGVSLVGARHDVPVPGSSTRRTLFVDLELHVGAGEMVAVVGPSGSGKTTVLRALGLFSPLDRGTYHLMGRDVSTLSDHAASKFRARSIGFVFQDFQLVDHLTALDNVLYGTRLAGRRSTQAVTASRNAMRAVGVEHLAKRTCRKLSGGERQRVTLARALAKQPALILADEPTGALDTATAATVFDHLRRGTVELGAACIIVTHDRDVAAACDRVVDLGDFAPSGAPHALLGANA